MQDNAGKGKTQKLFIITLCIYINILPTKRAILAQFHLKYISVNIHGEIKMCLSRTGAESTNLNCVHFIAQLTLKMDLLLPILRLQ